ncbi:diguanylate cyclase [Phreatobacter oligotrophus]|uniref:diguanylate cyclase n=1 Tax=Phreatobacter oligotrophus TaxID=1122261 RepID=A0A2T4YLQ4_9HYPH|nr:diguanylate cyclase [Phreatobacter oligotrophus]PTM44188.1 diguanylate cyclase with PAS/PAC sensor [Phreatobacter oligotrophus]
MAQLKSHIFSWPYGLLVALCVTIVGLGWYREIDIRNSDVHAAEVEATNLARSLVSQAEDSVELVDNALIGIVHWLENFGDRPRAVEHLKTLLNLRKATLPRLRGLFVYAADGEWVATSETDNVTGHNNSDRDYFQHHQATANRLPFIGSPVRSRSGGQWIITISRRLNGPHGEFAGVVLASIDVSYFVETYSQFKLGNEGSLALLRSDGTLLARSPVDEQAIGRNFTASPFYRHVTSDMSGVIHFQSVLDGVTRISAYQRSQKLPLLMLVARGHDEVLAPWRLEATWRMSMVVGLTLIIGLLGALMLRELAARQRLLATVSSREAEFRLLAEASNDMVTRIAFDGTLTYVSPASLRVLGWPPESLLGGHALAGVDVEDRAAVEAVVAELKRGDRTEALLAYRTRHRCTGTVWLESSLSVTHDPNTGRVDGVVAISRDVTEQKQLEGHLSRLATLDGLTGLANRRFLDDRAERELLLARQSRRDLSLLLLDADHFKAFNDTYGHLAGDHCLQQIAAVIQSHATRPGDLAARYGGEEFALLLADTSRDGALVVAERIRAAVADLQIPHAGNSSTAVVTVSIGIATANSIAGWPTLKSLIGQADEALYRAKTGGRNRVYAALLDECAPALQLT